MELGYNFETFKDDLIKPSFYFPNYQEWQTLSERTSQILCFQGLTIFTRKENEFGREKNLFTTFFFFSPRSEGFQPAFLITHLSTLQASDTYVTVTRVTNTLWSFFWYLGEVWKSFYLPVSYRESRLRTSSLTTFCSGYWPTRDLGPNVFNPQADRNPLANERMEFMAFQIFY